MVSKSVYRVLQVLSAVNVVLAVVMLVIELSEAGGALRLAHIALYGLGFVAFGVAATLEMRRPQSGRVWFVVGGVTLVTASVLYFLARSGAGG